MNYYKILALKADCNDSDIKAAFRRLAVNEHPDKVDGKSGQSKETARLRFREICEAFVVLSDAKLRAIFDQFGEKGLKEGAPNGKGGFSPAWTFSQDPDEVFADFFGSSSPFAGEFGPFVADPAPAVVAAQRRTKERPKLPALEANVYCSLEDLFTGCVKKVKVVRQKLQPDGKTTTPEERVFTVEIGRGWRAETRITFPKDGDEGPDSTPGDVVFVLKEKPHPWFRRDKNDLVFTAKISLSQALTGCSVDVTTLDRRVLPIAVSEIVSPSFSQIVHGEGMPLAKDPSKRGNLVLRFDIRFPDKLSLDQQNKLRAILGE